MERIPCVVIGAGVVGLAIGKVLAEAGVATMVLERHASFGMENSSRNSEVLHAGMYYQPGSLKADMCFTGRTLLKQYLQDRHITYHQCGKLIIASTLEERNQLHQIYYNGIKNGLKELQLLNKETVKLLEKEVIAEEAILSPFTSIIDSHELMLHYQADIEAASIENPSMVLFNCSVNKVLQYKPQGFKVITSQGSILCDYIINAAGLNAHHIAYNHINNYPKHYIPSLYMAKGNYYKLIGQSAPFQRLIYPIPSGGGLGIHATLDLVGNIRFGPDVEWMTSFHQESFNIESILNFQVNENLRNIFYHEIKKYWPGISMNHLEPDYAGIRPKLVGPDHHHHADDINNNNDDEYYMKGVTDFMIHDSSIHGLSGLISLFGIESPGLTSSLAIAHYVKNKLLFP